MLQNKFDLGSSRKKDNSVEENKEKDNIIVVEDVEQKKWNPRRYSLQRITAAAEKDTVQCTSTTNCNIEVNQSLPNAITPSTLETKIAVWNDTEFEKDEKAKSKNWMVKVHFNSDIKIIGEVFISSPTMGVSFEWQESVNEEEMANSPRVASLLKKKQGRLEK